MSADRQVSPRTAIQERREGTWRTVLVLALALILLVLAALYYSDRLTNWLAYDDEGGYLYAAWRISLGEAPYRDFLTPQLPVFLYPGALVLLLSGNSVAAVRWSALLLTLASAGILFLAARKLWGDAVGLLALLLVLMHQEVFWAARFFRPEASMLFWGILGLYVLILAYPKRRRWGLVTVGVCLALAMMAKLFGALIIAGVGLFVLAEGIRTRDWGDMWRSALLIGGSFAVILALFAIAFSIVSPEFIKAVLGHHLMQGSGTPWLEVVTKGLALYWDYVKTQPLFFLLAAVGGWRSFQGRPGERVYLWQVPTALAFLAMTRGLQGRHFTYVVPSLAALASLGLLYLVRLASGHRRWQRALVALASGVIVAVLARPYLAKNEMVASWGGDDTVSWIKRIQDLAEPDEYVISDYPGLNFFSARPTTRLVAGISRGAAKSGQIKGAAIIEEMEAVSAPLVLLNVAQGSHQFVNLTDYGQFKAYLQENYYLVERKQYDYRLMEVYYERDIWPGMIVDLDLGHQLRLSGYQWQNPTAAPGSDLRVLTRWHALAPMQDDYAVALRLVDDQGVEWGLGGKALVDIDKETYWDERGLEQPVDIPTSQWPVSEVTLEAFELPVPLATPPGKYRVIARVHREGQWAGLPILASDGAVLGYDVDLGLVTVSPATGFLAVDEIGMTMRLDADLGSALLLGADPPAEQARPGDHLDLSLLWSFKGPIAMDETIRILLRGEPGDLTLFQGSPIQASAGLEPGYPYRARYRMAIDSEASAGDYVLIVAAGEGAEAQVSRVSIAGHERVFDAPSLDGVQNAQMGDVALLLGYTLDSSSKTAGDQIDITLYWQALRPSEIPYTVFVHLMDDSGELLAQHDAQPVHGASPTTSWALGEVIADRYLLNVPTAPQGDLQIAVGWYDGATGRRIAVRDSSGDPVPDGRIMLDQLEPMPD